MVSKYVVTGSDQSWVLGTGCACSLWSGFRMNYRASYSSWDSAHHGEHECLGSHGSKVSRQHWPHLKISVGFHFYHVIWWFAFNSKKKSAITIVIFFHAQLNVNTRPTWPFQGHFLWSLWVNAVQNGLVSQCKLNSLAVQCELNNSRKQCQMDRSVCCHARF